MLVVEETKTAYANWAERLIVTKTGPVFVTIHSTSRCNLECFMCWHGTLKEMPVAITPEKLDPFLEKAEHVSFAGGEPLWITKNVNVVAGRILERILNKHRQIKIATYSNGVMLNKKMAKLVLERFEKIFFSVDTLDPAIYEKIRGKPLLNTVLDNIKYLGDLKKENGLSPSDEPLININSIIMASTLEGLPAVTKKLAELGGHTHSLVKLQDLFKNDFSYLGIHERMKKENPSIDMKEFNSRHNAGISEEIIRSDTGANLQLEKVKRELLDICSTEGLEMEDKSNIFRERMTPNPSSVESVCPNPWVLAYIHQNGNVFCCCANSMPLGNMAKQSFDEIWNGVAARELRASFVRGEMKGCVEHACEAVIDYFKIPRLYYNNLMRGLSAVNNAQCEIESILLLRTAPLLQTHITIKTLRKRFPQARITVATNSAGAREEIVYGDNVEILVYPADFFEPEVFENWWPASGVAEEYSLVVTVYNNEDRSGYENVEEILRLINAKQRIGITPNGKLINPL